MDTMVRCSRSAYSLTLAGLLLAGLFLVLSAACPVARADPGVRYVALDGADTGTCDSISGRCRTVQYAVGVAASCDEIWVAQGVYTGTGAAVVEIDESLTLCGGWNGATAGVRDPHAYPTTLDAQGARRGVQVGEGITVTLAGLTVTNGVAADYGAGLYARDADMTLRGVTFHQNAISTTLVPSAQGGGAMVEGGTLLVDGCSFAFNSVKSSSGPAGGGLAISDTLQATVEDTLFEGNDAWFGSGLRFWANSYPWASLAIRRSEFRDNGRGLSPGTASGGYGSAISVGQADLSVEDSIFTGNHAGNGHGTVSVAFGELAMERNLVYDNESMGDTPGVWLHWVSPFTLTNNLIVGNRSSYEWEEHHAVHVEGSTGVMLHNTIASNSNNIGIGLEGAATVSLDNTILVSHTVGITVAAGSEARLTGTLFGEKPWANGDDWAGEGEISVEPTLNFWGDPAFADYLGGDYHITAGSDAIDQGLASAVTDDVDGESRPRDGDGSGTAEPDIGADEWVDYRYLYLPLVLRSG